MVKVSITLPNNAQIIFEAEEPEDLHEIVGMVLRDLPRDLMQVSGQTNGQGEHHPEPSNGGSKATVPTETSPASAISPGHVETETVAPEPVAPEPVDTKTVTAGANSVDNGQTVAETPTLATAAETRFIEFCKTANPLGDMRRVVVAAEAGRQFLNLASVDAEELGRLFHLADWPGPHSIVQTLRNAARSKFRWLERVPGRSGHYTLTEVGRSIALGG